MLMRNSRDRRSLISGKGYPSFLAVILLSVGLMSGGCTVLQNLKKRPSDNEVVRTVDERKAFIDEVKGNALRVAPSEYGQALALVSEMEYHLEKNDTGEVWRIENKLSPVISRIQINIKKYPAASWENDPSQYRARMAMLISEVEGLKLQNNLLGKRVLSVETARDNAIKEVVRTRSRIQDLASPAEAAAMFAEARVIVDRIAEDAYNYEAREYRDLARKFLKDGTTELESNNPGGAAYLFDLVSATYDDFRRIDPHSLTVSVRLALLRAGPSKSSSKKSVLSYGTVVEGSARKGHWFFVKTPQGIEGWIHDSVVH